MDDLNKQFNGLSFQEIFYEIKYFLMNEKKFFNNNDFKDAMSVNQNSWRLL